MGSMQQQEVDDCQLVWGASTNLPCVSSVYNIYLHLQFVVPNDDDFRGRLKSRRNKSGFQSENKDNWTPLVTIVRRVYDLTIIERSTKEEINLGWLSIGCYKVGWSWIISLRPSRALLKAPSLTFMSRWKSLERRVFPRKNGFTTCVDLAKMSRLKFIIPLGVFIKNWKAISFKLTNCEETFWQQLINKNVLEGKKWYPRDPKFSAFKKVLTSMLDLLINAL